MIYLHCLNTQVAAATNLKVAAILKEGESRTFEKQMEMF